MIIEPEPAGNFLYWPKVLKIVSILEISRSKQGHLLSFDEHRGPRLVFLALDKLCFRYLIF